MTTSMTRKHFQAIADAISESMPDRGAWSTTEYGTEAFNVATEQHKLTARAIAYNLRQFNPAFDKAKFLKACGVD